MSAARTKTLGRYYEPVPHVARVAVNLPVHLAPRIQRDNSELMNVRVRSQLNFKLLYILSSAVTPYGRTSQELTSSVRDILAWHSAPVIGVPRGQVHSGAAVGLLLRTPHPPRHAQAAPPPRLCKRNLESEWNSSRRPRRGGAPPTRPQGVTSTRYYDNYLC